MPLQYQSGFGNNCATEALPGAPFLGAEFFTTMPLRLVCRTTFRLCVYCAPSGEPSLLAISNTARRTSQALPDVCRDTALVQ